MNKSEMYRRAKKYARRLDMKRAYECYLEAVLSEDDGQAMYELGQMYFEGEYVRHDYDKAGLYFGNAYDSGAEIEFWTLVIAGWYWEQQSEGSASALLKAMEYYKLAGDNGVNTGYECLGRMYFEMKKYTLAYEYLRRPEQYTTMGLYFMGRIYEEGLGVAKDIEKAVGYYTKAVEYGDDVHEYGDDYYGVCARSKCKELGVTVFGKTVTE